MKAHLSFSFNRFDQELEFLMSRFKSSKEANDNEPLQTPGAKLIKPLKNQ